MGKVVIEFDSFEEATEIENALNGSKWKSVVWDIDQYLRNQTKHNDTLSDETIEALEKVRIELYQSIHDNHLNLH